MTPAAYRLTLEAPAKVNLALRVVGRRPDGFHELEMVMQTISLLDRVHLERRAEPGIVLAADVPWVPAGEANLAWRGAARFFAATGARGGVGIRLEKRIPAGGGLGGGSSDLAAVLVGMDRLWSTGLGVPGLRQLAAELGSDAPFFVTGGTAVCRGRGERIEALSGAPELHLVLLLPSFPCPTPLVYRALAPGDGSRAEKFRDAVAMMSEAAADPRRWLFNDLEPAALRAVPALAVLWKELETMGLGELRISGSGSTLFRAFRDLAPAREFAARAVRLVPPGRAAVVAARSLPRREEPA